MRTFLLAIVALFIAGCASTPANLTKVYDHKYNTYSYAPQSTQSEFVGTSAAPAKPSPSWYKFGHP